MSLKPTDRPPGRGRALVTIVILLVILTPFAWSALTHIATPADNPADLFLEYPDSTHKACVRDTDYMRYHHWELLRGIREEVVRYGIRGDIVLDKCRECHTSRERFCNKCHDAVSLIPDCFECHYYP